jgi:hypothetical protein
MKVSALDVVTALQVLTQAALTSQQIAELMAKPDFTEADVQAQFDKTDATLDRVKADD